MRRRIPFLMLAFALSQTGTFAADPPVTVNYQGVLRDSADRPRNGTFEMDFIFYSSASPSAGTQILTDIHSVVNVSTGLFNVRLGAGNLILDGSGPGTYSSLDQVFRDFGDVWMQIVVGGEQLLPLIHVESAPFALNARSLQGLPAAAFVDTSSTPQSKSGPIAVTSATDPALHGSSAGGGVGELGTNFFGFPVGVYGHGPGIAGGFLNDSSSAAILAEDNYGIEAIGAGTGGFFENFSYGGRALVGTGRAGIEAFGIYPSPAGHFVADGYLGEASLAIGDTGILARGNYNAGEFQDVLSLRSAYLASDWAATAGYFQNQNSGIFTFVATDTGSGVFTNGPKNFVQNHPSRSDRAIAYTALEGPEAGTYTRGHGTLRGPEARIALDGTFALTTDPDIGLTAILTPRGGPGDLYVASVSTQELVVRSATTTGAPIEFDYLVNGLRAGFENAPVVVRNAPFPSAVVPDLAASEARLEGEPEDVRGSTPRARFSEAPGAKGTVAASPVVDLPGARALIAGINSPDHAAHALAAPAKTAVAPALPDRASNPPAASISGWSALKKEPPASSAPAPAPPTAVESVPWLTVAVEGVVEPGDVLANDPEGRGPMRRPGVVGDAGVVGIVAALPAPGQARLAPSGSIVLCKADATSRPIAPNDLLISSPLPGFAMAGATDPRAGTVLGKALEPLEAGTGMIRVLVMAR
jgi:hypothetical protein